jgi:hypothetical protein
MMTNLDEEEKLAVTPKIYSTGTVRSCGRA